MAKDKVGASDGDALGDVGSCDSDGSFEGLTDVVGPRDGDSLGFGLGLSDMVGRPEATVEGIPVGKMDG